jgi:hypothetical protein
MKVISSLEEIAKLKTTDMVTLECLFCGHNFKRLKKQYLEVIRGKRKYCDYCSTTCSTTHNHRKDGKLPSQTVSCKQCDKLYLKRDKEIKKSPNHFCSSSCSATYNNTHKNKGTRRSKLEVWLEEQLISLYPNLQILYSNKTTINSELDIYIPSLKLAFELNGIFHYEPIFGKDKLSQIKNNDSRKFQACIENGIELCIIDTSQHKYVKPSTSQKYLDIITKLVTSKLEASKTDCVEVL